MKKIYSIIFLFFYMAFAHAEIVQNKIPQKTFEQFESYVQKILKKQQVPGAAVAIVSKDAVLWMKTYGIRSMKTRESVDEYTVFRTASISKGFSAELTAMMIDKGLLNWEDTIIKYLPYFKLHSEEATQDLTILDILSQRTGLPGNSGDLLLEQGATYEKALSALKTIPLTCKVGTCYAYQNITFSMIEPILHKVTYTNFDALMKKHIFEPLKMKNASMTKEALLKNPNHADCHKLNEQKKMSTCSINNFPYEATPAAGINASLNDLIIWMQAQMGAYPEIITPTILKTVYTPRVNTPDQLNKPYAPWQKDRIRQAEYGLGWRIFDYAGTPMIYHSGMLEGVGSTLAFLPEHNIGVITLANTDNLPPGIIDARFFDLYLGIPSKDWMDVD